MSADVPLPPLGFIGANVGFVSVLLTHLWFFCSVNDFSTTCRPIYAKVRMRAYSGSGCIFSPFGG